jgi:hypothetical protein
VIYCSLNWFAEGAVHDRFVNCLQPILYFLILMSFVEDFLDELLKPEIFLTAQVISSSDFELNFLVFDMIQSPR